MVVKLDVPFCSDYREHYSYLSSYSDYAYSLGFVDYTLDSSDDHRVGIACYLDSSDDCTYSASLKDAFDAKHDNIKNEIFFNFP